MQTELNACQSARNQYRAAFKSMASGGAWHLFSGSAGIVLMRAEDGHGMATLVENVQAKAEQTMVNALSAAIRRRA